MKKGLTVDEIRAKDFLTVEEASKVLRVSKRTAYRMVREGKLRSVNLSKRKTLIRRVDMPE
jgi:excisionase family DNA binding protein